MTVGDFNNKWRSYAIDDSLIRSGAKKLLYKISKLNEVYNYKVERISMGADLDIQKGELLLSQAGSRKSFSSQDSSTTGSGSLLSEAGDTDGIKLSGEDKFIRLQILKENYMQEKNQIISLYIKNCFLKAFESLELFVKLQFNELLNDFQKNDKVRSNIVRQIAMLESDLSVAVDTNNIAAIYSVHEHASKLHAKVCHIRDNVFLNLKNFITTQKSATTRCLYLLNKLALRKSAYLTIDNEDLSYIDCLYFVNGLHEVSQDFDQDAIVNAQDCILLTFDERYCIYKQFLEQCIGIEFNKQMVNKIFGNSPYVREFEYFGHGTRISLYNELENLLKLDFYTFDLDSLYQMIQASTNNLTKILEKCNSLIHSGTSHDENNNDDLLKLEKTMRLKPGTTSKINDLKIEQRHLTDKEAILIKNYNLIQKEYFIYPKEYNYEVLFKLNEMFEQKLLNAKEKSIFFDDFNEHTDSCTEITRIGDSKSNKYLLLSRFGSMAKVKALPFYLHGELDETSLSLMNQLADFNGFLNGKKPVTTFSYTKTTFQENINVYQNVTFAKIASKNKQNFGYNIVEFRWDHGTSSRQTLEKLKSIDYLYHLKNFNLFVYSMVLFKMAVVDDELTSYKNLINKKLNLLQIIENRIQRIKQRKELSAKLQKIRQREQRESKSTQRLRYWNEFDDDPEEAGLICDEEAGVVYGRSSGLIPSSIVKTIVKMSLKVNDFWKKVGLGLFSEPQNKVTILPRDHQSAHNTSCTNLPANMNYGYLDSYANSVVTNEEVGHDTGISGDTMVTETEMEDESQDHDLVLTFLYSILAIVSLAIILVLNFVLYSISIINNFNEISHFVLVQVIIYTSLIISFLAINFAAILLFNRIQQGPLIHYVGVCLVMTLNVFEILFILKQLVEF